MKDNQQLKKTEFAETHMNFLVAQHYHLYLVAQLPVLFYFVLLLLAFFLFFSPFYFLNKSNCSFNLNRVFFISCISLKFLSLSSTSVLEINTVLSFAKLSFSSRSLILPKRS